MDAQRAKEEALILALCEEVGEEENADGTATAAWTEEEKIAGFRDNHPPDLIRAAADGEVTALVELRRNCGLPIVS